ncbi:LuxR family transcriptional regulator [Rhizorhabdus dicambivorans]|nr:LuxR family transcriptional regulator [Rhizorhabdus dicambivorans]
MHAITHELGFRFFALIHHDELEPAKSGTIDVSEYPDAVRERLFRQRLFRRDPIIRACIFADGAFLWSELPNIIKLDRHDRKSLDHGRTVGLNEGITVPFVRIGERIGSCTLAGIKQPDHAGRYLGLVQLIGIFAFQAARRLTRSQLSLPADPPRLHPRPRDCVVLAGRGYSNKRIARALDLTPRTVDSYLTEARRLFDAHDRTELVVSAVLAGEVDLHELRRQPE